MNYKYAFTNHIVFGLVMKDKEICRELLQRIFPDKVIREIRLHNVKSSIEETILVGIESHGVRLDVLFEGNDAWYDIEMQVLDEKNIPKRTRYTHGIMDVNTLATGENYNNLKNGYVIFICSFDPFKMGLPRYNFEMHDAQNHLNLNDETYTIVLNTRANADTIPEELRTFFEYVQNAQVSSNDSLVERIDESVKYWNTGKGMERVMLYEIHQRILQKEMEDKALARGREEGLREGHVKTALGMKKDGFDIHLIAKYTGLTEEEIANL